uniref:Uncharacterized protein n=1 Tax=Euplotes harpa TaxID=151035 RepID=A0A7S3J160_9SPIT|mmetsp:Transcript_1119/g.1102  ORF Transcript_1119/g.1102 Transcript_1119/m.1102 type:complete len:115 (+) Transcript_1119:102-446(+)
MPYLSNKAIFTVKQLQLEDSVQLPPRTSRLFVPAVMPTSVYLEDRAFQFLNEECDSFFTGCIQLKNNKAVYGKECVLKELQLLCSSSSLFKHSAKSLIEKTMRITDSIIGTVAK